MTAVLYGLVVLAIGGLAAMVRSSLALRARRITYRQYDYDLKDPLKGATETGTTLSASMLVFTNTSHGPLWLFGGHDIRPEDFFSCLTIKVVGHSALLKSVQVAEARPESLRISKKDEDAGSVVFEPFFFNRGHSFVASLIVSRPDVRKGLDKLLNSPAVRLEIVCGVSWIRDLRRIGSTAPGGLRRILWVFVAVLLLVSVFVVLYNLLPTARDWLSLGLQAAASLLGFSYMALGYWDAAREYRQSRHLEKIPGSYEPTGRLVRPGSGTETKAVRLFEGVLRLFGILFGVFALFYALDSAGLIDFLPLFAWNPRQEVGEPEGARLRLPEKPLPE